MAHDRKPRLCVGRVAGQRGDFGEYLRSQIAREQSQKAGVGGLGQFRVYIGAGSTVTKDVPADDLGVARARQTNIKGWAAKYRNS